MTAGRSAPASVVGRPAEMVPRPPPGASPRPAGGIGPARCSPLDPKERLSGVQSASQAEEWAAKALEQAAPVTAEQLLAVLSKLPSRSFAGGAYAHGGVSGLRTQTSELPRCCALVCRLVRECAPSFAFNAVLVCEQGKTAWHRDHHNAPSPNVVLPLSRFAGGGIFVQHGGGSNSHTRDGAVVRGTLIDIASGPAAFHAFAFDHVVLPWQGTRTVVVAYSVKGIERQREEDLDVLRKLGFPLEAVTPDSFVPAVPRVAMRVTDPRVQLPAVPLGKPVSAPEADALPVSLTPSKLLVIELFAGCALLSACCKQRGFEVLPVDSIHNKAKPTVHVTTLDLRQKHSWDIIRQVIQARQVAHVHAAPPCGTASRAHELPGGPAPVRSPEEPLGLSTLQGTDLAKVRSANQIYLHLAALCQDMVRTRVPFSVENPGNSIMWLIPVWRDLVHTCRQVRFDSCCHGGLRKKSTLFLTNVPEFEQLRATCQNDHPHAPWGKVLHMGKMVFATSLEAAYPRVLCERVAAAVVLACARRGFAVEPLTEFSSTPAVAAAAATGKLPRLSKFKPLVPEFAHTVTVTLQASGLLPLDSKHCLTRALQGVPAGARLLKGVEGASCKGSAGDRVSFGVYRSEEQFVTFAKQLDHPFDTCRAIPDGLLRVLAAKLMRSPVETMKARLQTLTKWQAWAAELEGAEAGLRSSMDPCVAKVLQGKRLLLLERVADDLGWPDKSLHSELREGFRLTGTQFPSGVFDHACKLAEISEVQLHEKGKFLRPALWAKQRRANPPEVGKALWDQAMEEVEQKGWLQPPRSWDDLCRDFGETWLPTRRFGVVQKTKVRAVDDLSENAVNSAFTSFEKVGLRALDELVWSCLFVLRCVRVHGCVDVVLSDGQRIRGPVHHWWLSHPDAARPVMKTIDLKSAYKQFALRPSERPLVTVCLESPVDGEVKGFVATALPFGAVASVLHFNRAARLLQRLFWEVALASANYFDDYPVMELQGLAANAESTASAVCKLVGFKTASDKELPFSASASMLGVVVEASDASGSHVLVRNKGERAAELVESLDEVLCRGSVAPQEVPRLFGRLQFAEAQVLGREGKLAMASLRHIERAAGPVELDQTTRDAFSLLRSRMARGVPRSIPCSSGGRVAIVFTDGACEPAGESGFSLGVGGLLLVRDAGVWACRAFGCAIDDGLNQAWAATGKKHLIGPTELYAVVLARVVWADALGSARSFFYVDHGGVLSALVNGSSRDATWRELLVHFERADAASPTLPWFCRVPSKSNPSDPPSRGRWEFPPGLNPARDRPVCFVTGRRLRDSVPQ